MHTNIQNSPEANRALCYTQTNAVQLQTCTIQLNTVTVSKVVRKLMGCISFMDEDSILRCVI